MNTPPQAPPPTWRDSGPLQFALIALVAVVVAALVYFLVIDDDDEGQGGSATGADLSAGAGAVEATEGDLSRLAGKLDFPVYWAGDQGQDRLELTRTIDDRVYVRYLDGGAKLGTSEPDYLTVGTYPIKGAFEALEKQSQEAGAVVEETPDGGLVVTNESAPTSVYIAFEDEDYQIEVFDPDPETALDLATSGQIEPVD